MATVTAAGGTFVMISREELEEWLNSIGFSGKWDRDPRYQGIYLLKLAPSVAVKLSSTIGSKDDAMGKGRAAMQLSLVSTVTGRTLNKKAQGQDHFKRTSGWKKTWAVGIDTMKKAYLSSSDFYDAIAVIQDRDAYRDDILRRVEKIPGWDNDGELISIFRKVDRGGVLMKGELDAIEEAEKRPKPMTPDPQKIEPGRAEGEGITYRDPEVTKDLRLDALRKLWVLAKRGLAEATQRNDERGAKDHEWTMQFAQDMATKYVNPGRRLSGPQLRVIGDKMEKYRIPDKNGDPAYNLF